MTARVRVVNDRRPWWGMLRGPEYSLADLVANGTLSEEAADVLARGVGRGASLFVAAGPPGAGKSTLATALLEFLPADAQLYVTAGPWDPLNIPDDGGPVYLLINELSWHMPLYLHGPAAQRAFGLLARGVRMIGTLHARSVAEALAALCDEADVPPSALSTAMLIAVVQASWTAKRTLVRRVVEIGFLSPVAGSAPRVVCLAAGQPLRLYPEGVTVLDRWLPLPLGEGQGEG